MNTIDKFKERKAQERPSPFAPATGGDKVWVVHDTTAEGTEVFEVDANGLARYVIGTGLDRWMNENTTIYYNETDARADAEGKLRA